MSVFIKKIVILIFLFVFFVSSVVFAAGPAPLYDQPVHLSDNGSISQPSKKTSQYSKKTKDAKKEKEATKHKKRLWQYKKSRFNLYSIDNEIEIGKTFQKKQIKSFAKKGNKVNPPKYKALKKRVDRIVKRLAKVSDIPNLPYEVTIFEKDDVANAYCLPGGKIGIFTGIFTQVNKDKGMIDMNSDDEIAAVLSHEMAHATMRHVSRRMTTYNALGVVGSLVTMGVSKGAGQNWGYLANQVFSTGTSLYLPSYSRKHEKEADQVGFYYMAKAGYDPKAAISVWDRASVKASKKGKNKTQFFSSHPASGERANNLRGYYNDALIVQKQDKKQKELYKKMRE